MKSNRTLAITVAVIALLMTSNVNSQDAHPLQGFERLMGGQWHLDESYQEFEWGVGRQSVRARSYFAVDGQPKLVSEGYWYWHPGEKQIKGLFTAIDMPVVLFEYTTRFEGSTMVNDLTTFAANGNETTFAETWEFVDDMQFEWKLTSELSDGTEAMMSGTYVRTKSLR